MASKEELIEVLKLLAGDSPVRPEVEELLAKRLREEG